ncbi:MAG: prolyl aminopeptidase [Rhodospirillales bacterium]|jgi:proline iminopeptidase|nr:prolyl aminopeptidase [Rhodospirillaceae bacterium]MDP6430586.1 prolyl aminopeptidase [Rhodospirillales bacterium]MDP6645300.1 prolyl aminopeptidase [Rhodospirillales bacterium]MDP6841620.1 prolyl aminopeptidase [Rhodospirillales bacterium]
MDVSQSQYQLYPEIQPHAKGMLDLDGHHKMYWEISGNPEGVPAVFLHGGPGAGASPSHRRFFDPDYYAIVVFDQRGSGRSKPFAEIADNTTQHLINDMEALRRHLQFDKWLVFGGSWGSALGLAYGIEYPDRVAGFVLRGIFLCRQLELDWFLGGIAAIYPENWRAFLDHLEAHERHDPLNAYHQRLMHPDPAVHGPAARVWARFEGACSTLMPSPRSVSSLETGREALALAHIEAHYFVNNLFLSDDHFFSHLDRIRVIPTTIVQGRYDMVCPVRTADELAAAWSEAEYVIVPDAGHSAMEPSIRSALVAATERFKRY